MYLMDSYIGLKTISKKNKNIHLKSHNSGSSQENAVEQAMLSGSKSCNADFLT